MDEVHKMRLKLRKKKVSLYLASEAMTPNIKNDSTYKNMLIITKPNNDEYKKITIQFSGLSYLIIQIIKLTLPEF